MAKEWVWAPPRLERFDLSDATQYGEFRDRYLGTLDGGQALTQILTVVASNPEVSCYVERDYIDRDYRDEFANFYAGTYRTMFDRCQRLHFFAGDGGHYLGFVVLRPLPGRIVSRTILAPPPALEPFVSCRAADVATLYGIEQAVKGAPFISQDFQFGVCAHAAIWMVAQYFNLRFGYRRLHMSDIVQAASLQPGHHRITPSRGLTPQQLSGAMDALGMLPLNYPLTNDDGRNNAREIARTHLDSGVPLLLTRGRHVQVLIGYCHVEGVLHFVVHDDSRGPYLLLDAQQALVEGDRLLVPSPGRVYLELQAAQTAAQFHFNELMEEDAIAGQLTDVPAEALEMRAYLTEINDYRKGLVGRGLTRDAVAWLSMSSASHWIWVVELWDRRAAAKGKTCVLGEVAVDATTDARHAHVLFGLMPSCAFRWGEPKSGETRRLVQQSGLYDSGCAIHSVP
jgi:hypothetical protein